MSKTQNKGFMALAFKLVAKIPSLLKLGKIALAGASLAAYSFLFTWKFAVIILGMLVIHENGHLWFMKRYRMKTKGIYMIPFLGAAAVAEDKFPSRKAEAVIAIAGPITGGLLAVAFALAYLITHDGFLAAVAAWMALVNLFNLLPVVPLDGGRILKSVACSLGSKIGTLVVVGGLLLGAALAFTQDLWIFVILIPVGILDYFLDTFLEFRRRRKEARLLAETNEKFRNICGKLNMPFEPYKELPGKRSRTPVMTPMGKKDTALAFAGYAALAVALWLLMVAMSTAPGAISAMKALQG